MAENKERQHSEQELVELVHKKAGAYLRLPNVTSVGVGYKMEGGRETDQLAIQFTVGKKLSPEQVILEGLTLLPETITADDGTEIPVDVFERSYKPAYEIVEVPAHRAETETLSSAKQRRRRLDPIRPGISVSHVDGTAGTIGAIVFDNANGTPYILSNWHVLHGPTGKVGDRIAQPGPFDDGNVFGNIVGNLVRSHLGLSGDCAVCSIAGRGTDARTLETDVVPLRAGKANLGDKVVKSGRTTGVTFGIVRRVGVIVNLDYNRPFGVQQIGGFEIRPNPAKPASDGEISMGGDSGSCWLVDTDGADRDVVLGLHFAGEADPNPEEEHAVACAIHTVLEKLQIRFTNPLMGKEEERPRRRSAARPKRSTRKADNR